MELTSLSLIAVLAAVTCLILYRRPGRVRASGPAAVRQAAPGHAPAMPQAPVAPAARRMCTHAVSIESEGVPCGAARALSDQRFLSAEAPVLPLAGCDAQHCDCRYVHHDDRRSQEERRMPFTAYNGFGMQEHERERRKRPDRRRRRS